MSERKDIHMSRITLQRRTRLLARRYALAAAALVVAVFASDPTAAPRYSDWSAPVNLGGVLNSSSNDAAPAVSKDGLTLYFGSDRPGGSGSFDLWISQRASVDAPWGFPLNLGSVVNTGSIENVPALSRDEHWLFFNSNRAGGFGGNDIWASYREHIHDDFGWQPAINLGADINTAFVDQGAGYFENDDAGQPVLFFNSDRPGGMGAADIYMSPLLPNGWFGPPTLVTELNSVSQDARPSVRFDGREVVLFSSRAGSLGLFDLWASRRETVFEPWSLPLNLGPLVNSTANDQQPHIAPDSRALYFASDRAGGFGQFDLYGATRER
jgi:WD40 repeat protein